MNNAGAARSHHEDASQQMPLDLSPLFQNFFSTADGINFLADTMHTLEGQLGALCRKAQPDVQQVRRTYSNLRVCSGLFATKPQVAVLFCLLEEITRDAALLGVSNSRPFFRLIQSAC